MVVERQIGGATTPEQRLRIEWAESLRDHMESHRPRITKKHLVHALNERGAAVSRQAVEAWLSAKYTPKPIHQAHIAAVLGVPVRRLFPIEVAA